ncbi:hypothetical protein BGW41_007852 [Actinomortierella wolfii]|nr:hypothetical protein BGW41_007852 [Actinomortierella wolfii]
MSEKEVVDNEDEQDQLPVRPGPPSPEAKANVFSRATMWWLNGLFRKGYKQPIVEDDLWEMMECYKVSVLSKRMQHEWQKEQEQALGKGTKPSLLRALVHVHWREHWPHAVFLEIGEISQSQTPAPAAYHGYGIAIGMSLLSMLQNLTLRAWTAGCATVGILIRSELIDLIYCKVFRLSPRARLIYPDGAIINLMSTDVSRIDAAMQHLWLVVALPVFTIVIVGMLCRLLGPAALLGAALLILLNPLLAWIMKRLSVFRKRASGFTDRRIKLISETLQGIKVVKFFAWETKRQELKNTSTLFRFRSLVSSSSAALTIFAAASTLVLYAALGQELRPSIIFPAIAYFNVLRGRLVLLPAAYSSLADAYVALKRIEQFLLEEEFLWTPLLDEAHPYALSITDGSFYWNQLNTESTDAPTPSNGNCRCGDNICTQSERNASPQSDSIGNTNSMSSETPSTFLTNINLNIPKGSLVAVIGPVGSGKSSLLHAMMGTMQKASGTVYQRVIRACNLSEDLATFPDGDQTEIGERGINLSGGQKARLSLARSVYYDAEMVILDDPLSAVDAHVGKRIWQDCVMKELRGRTRIIATHQLHVLPDVDYIICMKNGIIAQKGTFPELMEQQGGEFKQLMAEYGGVREREDSVLDEALVTVVSFPMHATEDRNHIATDEVSQSPPLPDTIVKHSNGGEQRDLETRPDLGVRRITNRSDHSKNEDSMVDLSKSKPQKFMQAEERKRGAVGADVFAQYFRSGSRAWWFGVLLFFLLQQAANIMGTQWVSWWSEKKFVLSTENYIAVYVSWAALQMIFLNIGTQLLTYVVILTSNVLHDAAFQKVLYSPVAFFESTPTGRILNRFSRDVDSLDGIIGKNLFNVLFMIANVLGTLVLVIVVHPWLVLAILPMLAIYYFTSVYYQSTSREVRRLDSNFRSFLYANFSESLTGLETIKGYQAVERSIRKNRRYIDLVNRSYYLFQLGGRWLSIRVNAIGIILVFCTTLFIVGTRFKVNVATAGLVLSYLARISSDLNVLVQRSASLGNNMNAAERLVHYIRNLEQEPPAVIPETKPPPEWPQAGRVVFDQVSVRYRPGQPLVLKDITLSIEAGHKIGVVGRTGAGKSSLVYALFRLVDVDQGRIWIDGIDIKTLGTADLRTRISIIPQDPVLFQGMFRYNLDPLGRHTDEELWRVLETTCLKDYVREKEGGLDAVVAAHGENLSVGQRQLICLSRTLLAKSKVVILDEATANVDLATDTLIQNTIRKDFADATVVTIAHRLNTIIDYNKVLVMDQGLVAEFDSVKALLERPDSLFSTIVNETGEKNAALLRSLAGCT